MTARFSWTDRQVTELIENTVIHRQPVQLSQSWGDVFTFMYCF